MSNIIITKRKELFEWKWSTGEPYKKSCRSVQPSKNTDEEIIEQCLETNNFLNSIPHKDMNSTQMKLSNKREEQNAKLNNRELMIQTAINPFMDNTNYVDDLQNEDEFLRPKDSNSGSSINITYSS